MKNIRGFLATIMTLCMIMNCNIIAFAANLSTEEPCINYSIDIENDQALNDAIMISTNSYIENDRAITETVYKQSDGTIIVDTLNISAVAPFSKEGTDTATRKRTISNWGSITITASFKWYTEGLFSYVKCTSMSSSHSLDSKAVVSKWEESYTKDYVSIGKATAQVEYYFYNSAVPFQYQEGTFKITCSDSGTISDNN